MSENNEQSTDKKFPANNYTDIKPLRRDPVQGLQKDGEKELRIISLLQMEAN